MKRKEITVVLYRRSFPRADWRYEIDVPQLTDFFDRLIEELSPLGIDLQWLEDNERMLEVEGYGDLLNCVRIRSPQDHIANLCLGHIIGASANRDLLEDIRRGVNRVAFAPEMVEPEEDNKRVCHNCGCGC
ncbi:MAG: hypothetical protein WDA20_06560 [Desulfuromonadales bacterium]